MAKKLMSDAEKARLIAIVEKEWTSQPLTGEEKNFLKDNYREAFKLIFEVENEKMM